MSYTNRRAFTPVAGMSTNDQERIRQLQDQIKRLVADNARLEKELEIANAKIAELDRLLDVEISLKESYKQGGSNHVRTNNRPRQDSPEPVPDAAR